MGTQLMLAGLEQGNCGEAWNLTHPERVLAIQRRYAEAGSDCIITNTFGGSRASCSTATATPTTSPGSTRRPSRSRARRSASGTGYVIGDIGPFGGLMEPYGDFTEDAGPGRVRRAGARARRRRRRRDHHRDADVARGAAASRSTPRRRPARACVIGSMAYDVTLDGSTFRTMMGIDPEHAAEFMVEHGADIVALNCGTRHGHGARAPGGRALSSGRPACRSWRSRTPASPSSST